MELKRRDRMSFVLLILWTIPTITALSGLNLDCTNDYEDSMFCHFEAQNCSEYNLTLRSNEGHREPRCIIKQCDSVGQCCCSFNGMIIVLGESHNATVWKGGDSTKPKHIDIAATIKPKTPTIISVDKSNGNFEVKWKTNYNRKMNMMAKVTYHKKGDTQEEPKSINLTTNDGLNNYEISGQVLKPSTTYVVSVKSYIDFSNKFSDSSEEKEFTTPVNPVVLTLVIIISLSVAAVIITGAIYVCYVKLKTKWLNIVAKCPNPKLLIMHPSKEELLKPVQPTISSVCVEPIVPDDSKPWSKGSLSTSSGCLEQSSGFSTGSSCLSNANTEPADIIAGVQDALGKAFANINPVSPLTTNPLAESNKVGGLLSSPYNPCGVRADEMSSGSFGFINKTYSILIPSCPHQIVTDSSEVQTQAEMLCDSAYHPIAGDVEPSVDQQAPACPLVDFPPVVLSVMPTDMSYQQSNADSGGFPNAEDSCLSSVSSGTNTVASGDPVTRVEAGRESSDEVVQGATKPHGKTEEADENPCYGSVPAGSSSLPPVDDDYQPFHNLVEQPDVLFSEERSDEKEEHLNKYPGESFTEMHQSFLSPVAANFINNVQGDQCLSELQRPFLPLIPADQ
ncbi:uncharacterized protein LOC141753518 isoform X2 [Sebastes fasciatus]|uniref:uncharacterized protein LOC141753518 isoform X2 n=1 Tax=Sebastes fasciatus TaxID=394691 RepID=UPI003D9F35EE